MKRQLISTGIRAWYPERKRCMVCDRRMYLLTDVTYKTAQYGIVREHVPTCDKCLENKFEKGREHES